MKKYVKIAQQIKVPMSWGKLQKHWKENKCKTDKSGYEMSVSHGADSSRICSGPT